MPSYIVSKDPLKVMKLHQDQIDEAIFNKNGTTGSVYQKVYIRYFM